MLNFNFPPSKTNLGLETSVRALAITFLAGVLAYALRLEIFLCRCAPPILELFHITYFAQLTSKNYLIFTKLTRLTFRTPVFSLMLSLKFPFLFLTLAVQTWLQICVVFPKNWVLKLVNKSTCSFLLVPADTPTQSAESFPFLINMHKIVSKGLRQSSRSDECYQIHRNPQN